MSASPQNSRMAIKLVILVVVMLVASFAAVPFYRLFCQLTGFGGTAQRVAQLPEGDQISQRSVTVTFNADTSPDLPWSFKPEQGTITARLGEPFTVHYRVTNNSQQAWVGTATHNIQPDRVAPYFNKVECFCFVEQVLQAGETRQMPVTFFLDPDMAKDTALGDVQAVTLSYTFFAAKDQTKAKSHPVAQPERLP